MIEILRSFKAPQIMGICNVTPDSFSDGGEHFDSAAACKHVSYLITSGADIIDLGGESTRPGAMELDAEIEMKRLEPVLRYIKQRHPKIKISVDTRHSKTAAMAMNYGVHYINDISALRHDPQMAELLAKHPQTKLILMHMQGLPKNMQDAPFYDDLLGEISSFFKQRIAYCEANGISKERLLLDPGIGFGKNLEHNIQLISGIKHFAIFGLPLVLGASRKRFINEIHPSTAQMRIGGSLAAALMASLNQVELIRVHDVFEHAQFFALIKAFKELRL